MRELQAHPQLAASLFTNNAVPVSLFSININIFNQYIPSQETHAEDCFVTQWHLMC